MTCLTLAGLSLEMNSVISDVLKLTKRPIASASDVIQKLERRSISITPRAIPIVSNGSPTQRLSKFNCHFCLAVL